MGLSFSSVQKAYKVFNELKQRHIPDLTIPAWPEDFSLRTTEERKLPTEKLVYGWDRKNFGWENIFFFIKSPSKELLQSFEELKRQVPNSSISSTHNDNPDYWILGWF